MSALTAPYAVLHVMSHAGHDDGEPYSLSEDGAEVSLVHLAEVLRDGGRGLQVGAVLADGCGTGTGVWKRAFRECMRGDVTYIGARGNIGWYEATAFSSACYSALLRNRGRGAAQPEKALEAADRAARAYTEITDENCPYVAETLTPSRRPLKAFNG